MDRKQAKELGIKTYSGKPCRRCNTTDKYTNNCGCVECSKTIHQPSMEVRKRYEQSVKGKNVRKKINQSDAQKERAQKYDNSNKAKEKRADFYVNHPEKFLEYRVKRYGISVEQYNELLMEQQGCCKICGVHESDLTKSLAIDHCHTKKQVRSLLCMNCNTGLGLFKDNIELLKKAIKYLELH